jgi:ankyrin repeat protein
MQDWKHDLFMAISDDDEHALDRLLPQLKQGVDERVCSHLTMRQKVTFKYNKLKYTSSDTLLLLAARNNRTKCIEKLLTFGASVSLLDKDGKTAQQLASSDEALELISRSNFEIA